MESDKVPEILCGSTSDERPILELVTGLHPSLKGYIKENLNILRVKLHSMGITKAFQKIEADSVGAQ